VHKLIGTAIIILASVSAIAAESDPDETIIVTATRTEIPLTNATVPVTVISREDIELSMATDLAELLRFEAGIDIGRNGGPGQSTSVFMRGTESNHTLVLMDGVRINPGTIGGAAFQNIAPEIIERVEIVKGARSALYGTDAIGGVINIITRRPQRTYAEASAGGGSFNSRSGYFGGGTRTDNGEFGVTLDWNNTDGFPVRTGSDIDRGYDNTSINLHAGRNFGSSTVLLRHWSAFGTSEYLDFFLSPLDQDYENSSTALDIQSALGDSITSKLIVSHMVDDITQNQDDSFVESKRNSIDWQLSMTTEQHVLTGGLYYVDEDAGSFAFGSGFNEKTNVKAVFLQDQWSRDRHQTFVAVRLTGHETFGNETTWNAEYGFAINEDWTLQAGIGHAFRAPDATDRFGFGGNPDLAPELADEIQFGIRFNPGGRHKVDLEFYQNDIDHLIEFDLATFELKNISSAEIRGAQLAWEYRRDSFSLRANLVKQTADNAADGTRLLRRAEESGSVSVAKDIGEHRVGLTVLASGDREDFGGVVLPAYVLANLTGQINISENWRLNARVENLFDKTYETASGFTMQERSGFVEVRYSWN
jgi:vitamin B12 transporter